MFANAIGSISLFRRKSVITVEYGRCGESGGQSEGIISRILHRGLQSMEALLTRANLCNFLCVIKSRLSRAYREKRLLSFWKQSKP